MVYFAWPDVCNRKPKAKLLPDSVFYAGKLLIKLSFHDIIEHIITFREEIRWIEKMIPQKKGFPVRR